jgi:2-polyprenyl-3-methyl-5-hydroxy-6-metoxy-1,4-benzoquinol methylase
MGIAGMAALPAEAVRDADEEGGFYARTIAALPPCRFRAGLEIGCSIGELTRCLALHCDTWHGVDVVAAALETARKRCADLAHVSFSHMQVPAQWPDGSYDLIVLSEVLYFLSRADIALIAARVRDRLTGGGVVLLVNWRGVADNPIGGDAAARLFIAAVPQLACDVAQVFEAFRIDRLVSAPH